MKQSDAISVLEEHRKEKDLPIFHTWRAV